MSKQYVARIVVNEVTPEERVVSRYAGQADTVTPETLRVLLNATFNTETLNAAIERVQHVLKAEIIPQGLIEVKPRIDVGFVPWVDKGTPEVLP